ADIEEPLSGEFAMPKMASSTNKLLLFHRTPQGRTVMNVTATRRSLALALGVGEDEIGKRFSQAGYQGSVVREGTLSMEPPDLSRIPAMKFFPGDAGK